MKNNIYNEIGHIFTRVELSDTELILEDHLLIQDDLLVFRRKPCKVVGWRFPGVPLLVGVLRTCAVGPVVVRPRGCEFRPCWKCVYVYLLRIKMFVCSKTELWLIFQPGTYGTVSHRHKNYLQVVLRYKAGSKKIMRHPKVANHEILSAQHIKACRKKNDSPVTQRQKLVTYGTWAFLDLRQKIHFRWVIHLRQIVQQRNNSSLA